MTLEFWIIAPALDFCSVFKSAFWIISDISVSVTSVHWFWQPISCKYSYQVTRHGTMRRFLNEVCIHSRFTLFDSLCRSQSKPSTLYEKILVSENPDSNIFYTVYSRYRFKVIQSWYDNWITVASCYL